MSFLLDTNACIAHLTGRSPALTKRLRERTPSDVAICAIVRAELLFGAKKSQRVAENLARVERFVAPFVCFPFDDAAAAEYAEIRAELERRGAPIGPNDLLIASIARARGLTVVTANVGEFGRVPGLAVANWQ